MDLTREMTGNGFRPLVAEHGLFSLTYLELQVTSLQPVKTQVTGGCSVCHLYTTRCALKELGLCSWPGPGTTPIYNEHKLCHHQDSEDSPTLLGYCEDL